jgi:hypothetical protein
MKRIAFLSILFAALIEFAITTTAIHKSNLAWSPSFA